MLTAARRDLFRDVTLWSAAVAIPLSLSIALVTGRMLLAVPFALAAGLLMAAGFAIAPAAAATCLVLVCGAAAGPLSEMSLDLGFRIYAADFIILLVATGTIAGTFASPDRWNHRWPHRVEYLVLLAYLVASLAHGIAEHNDFRNALGDFRRMAVYPATFVALAAIVRSDDERTHLLNGLVIAGYLVAVIEIFRIVTGFGVLEGGSGAMTARNLSFHEASTAALAVLVLVGRARNRHGLDRTVTLLAAVPLIAAVLFSNYRTAWIALILGLLFQAAALGWQRAARMVIVGSLGLAPLVWLLVTGTSLGAQVLARLNPTDATNSGSWRVFSWLAAVRVWRQHPLAGTGLGYFHQFYWLKLQTGEIVHEVGRAVHNDVLWFLVNNGILGILFAAPFVAAIARRAIRLSNSPSPEARFVGSTTVGAVVVMFTNAALQPFFEFAAQSVLLGLFVVLTLRTSERDGCVEP